MKNNTTLILVAVGALLIGGIATAAYMNSRDRQPAFVTAPSGNTTPQLVDENESPETSQELVDAADPNAVQPVPDVLQYADIVKVDPVIRKEQVYATVINADPIRETTSTTVPKEVCEDVQVQERLPERDGNVGGTVVGAVLGGVLGNQVGGGSGKKAATAAGAVAGGVIGNQVDRRHEGGRVITRTERQCRTENEVSESTRVTGYNVTYRNANGTTGSMKMNERPGERIAMGTTDKVTGYTVTYRYNDEQGTVRMDRRPDGDRLPVIDGKVVTQVASVSK